MNASVFKTTNNINDVFDFFVSKGMIEQPDFIDEIDNLDEIEHKYFEISSDDDLILVALYDSNEDSNRIEAKFNENFFINYMILISSDYKDYKFIKSVEGTDKLLRLRKKKDDLEAVFIRKLEALRYDNIEHFEKIFDRSEFIKEFYQIYCDAEEYLAKRISGIPNEDEKEFFAQLIIQRFMFLWFIQQKGLLNSDKDYFKNNYHKIISNGQNFYLDFINLLFFQGLCVESEDRKAQIEKLLGDVPYLNGGLFIESEIEYNYKGLIKIPNDAFYNETMEYPIIRGEKNIPILNLLECKEWTVDEKSGDIDKINPEILGYIFEKSINKRDLGAVYTPEEITTYICKNTIYTYLLEQINKDMIIYENIDDFFENATKKEFKLILNVLKNISILDPAVGSGHFLVDTVFILENIYKKIYQFLGDKKGTYEIREHIIINNLFGVDILEGAVEICKLRLFLSLAESFSEKEDVQPLPNIDFNIRCGNSLIGFISTEELNQKFFIQGDAIQTLSKNIKFLDENFPEVALKAKNIGSKLDVDPMELFLLRNELVKIYRTLHNKNLQPKLRGVLKEITEAFNNELNGQYYENIRNIFSGIRKKDRFHKFIEIGQFHWIMEYSEVFEKGGFDIVVGNPPYKTKNLDSIERKLYRKIYEEVSTGRLNLYSMFIMRCFFLLSDEGIHSFITANSLLTDDFTKNLRDFIINKFKASEIFDILSRNEVFKGILQGTCLIFLRKKDFQNEEVTICRSFNPSNIGSRAFECGNIKRDLIFKDYEDGNIFFISPYQITYDIIGKLWDIPSLKDMNIKVQSGEIRQADSNVSPYLVNNPDPKSFPIIRGRNIGLFCIDTSDHRRDGWWYKRPMEKNMQLHRDMMGKTPRIVLQRITAREQPRRLVCSEISEDEIASHNRVYLENSANYLSLPKNIRKDEIQKSYLVGLLNSDLLNWYFHHINLTASVTPSDVEKLPVPTLKKENKSIISEISSISKQLTQFSNTFENTTESINIILNPSENIIQEEFTELFKLLNEKVFDLYHISPKEREFIYSWMDLMKSAFQKKTYEKEYKSMLKWVD